MWIIRDLFTSKKTPPPERKPTPLQVTPAPVRLVVPAEPGPSISEQAYEYAHKAEILIGDIEVELANAHKLSLKTEGIEGHLGTARSYLGATRRQLDKLDYIMAPASAETSFNFARWAKDEVLELLAKSEKMNKLFAKVNDRWCATVGEVTKASKLGSSIRSRAPVSWRALRLLDLAAEKRSKEVEKILAQATEELAAGDLGCVERDIDRANVWLDQTAGYAKTFAVLDRFLVILETELGNRAITAYELVRSAHPVFRDDFTVEATRHLDLAGNAYTEAKDPSNLEKLRIVLVESLAAIELMEARSQQETLRIMKILKQKQEGPDLTGWTAKDFAGSAYREILLSEFQLELKARFPKTLTNKERSDRETSYHNDGSPCCC